METRFVLVEEGRMKGDNAVTRTRNNRCKVYSVSWQIIYGLSQNSHQTTKYLRRLRNLNENIGKAAID